MHNRSDTVTCVVYPIQSLSSCKPLKSPHFLPLGHCSLKPIRSQAGNMRGVVWVTSGLGLVAERIICKRNLGSLCSKAEGADPEGRYDGRRCRASVAMAAAVWLARGVAGRPGNGAIESA
jgi:hypothetical protein